MPSYSVSSSPSTTHGSFSHHSSEDAHDYTRLQQAMEYELNHLSTNTSTGEHEEDDTVGSFDIENGHAATSTRRFDNLLPQQSPSVINSNILNQHFADFTMGGLGLTDTEDSIEIGRFHHGDANNDKSSSLPFSIGRASDSPQNRTPNARLSNRNSENVHPRSANKSIRTQSANLPRYASPLGKQPITTHVPKRGMSPLKNVRSQSKVINEDESTIGLSERPSNATATRFSGSPKNPSNSRRENNASRAREASNQLRAAEADLVAAKRSASGSINGGTPPKKNLPSAFKSTEEFFAELGLNPPTTTVQMTQTKPQNTKSSTHNPRPKHLMPNTTVQSIRLPDMTGISDLVSSYGGGDVSRTSYNGLSNHKAVDSIPIPADEKAILVALGLLQEKITNLEAEKTAQDGKVQEMMRNQEEIQQLYELEHQGRKAAEAELVQRKRSDSALGTDHEGSERGSYKKWAEEQQQLKTRHAIERMKLEGIISSQKQKIENTEQGSELLKISLRNMTEERNSAVGSLAVAISAKDALQRENNNLKIQLEREKNKVHDLESLVVEEREATSAKIDRYREKVKRLNRTAGQATESAREATNLLRESRELHARIKPTKAKSQDKQNTKKGKSRAVSIEQSVEDRIRDQVQEELRKISQSIQSTQKATASAESTQKATAQPENQTEVAPKHVEASKIEQVVTSSKSKNRRKRVIIEEISESESDEEPQPAVHIADPHNVVPEHNDTTFTDAESESQEDEGNGNYQQYEMAQDTVMSLVNPAEIEALRQQIQEERRLQEEADVEESEAEEDVTLKLPEQQSTKPESGRVFVYSAEEDVTIITEPEQEHDVQQNPATTTANGASQPLSSHQQVHDEHAQYYEHAQDIIDRLGTHDKDQCTICRRKTEVEQCNIKGHSGNVIFSTSHVDDIPAPEIIPVSKRMPAFDHDMGWEEEATMRPSMAPKTALERVLQQMTDEFNHLKINYNNAQTEYLNMDPSLGKRKRKAITIKMNSMVEEMDKKADQIYALYDVAELVHQDQDEDFEESISQIDEHQRERRRSETRRESVEI